jgi:uncharacterized membrane protein
MGALGLMGAIIGSMMGAVVGSMGAVVGSMMGAVIRKKHVRNFFGGKRD